MYWRRKVAAATSTTSTMLAHKRSACCDGSSKRDGTSSARLYIIWFRRCQQNQPVRLWLELTAPSWRCKHTHTIAVFPNSFVFGVRMMKWVEYIAPHTGYNTWPIKFPPEKCSNPIAGGAYFMYSPGNRNHLCLVYTNTNIHRQQQQQQQHYRRDSIDSKNTKTRFIFV